MQSELIADVLEAQDHYPGGMIMPGRSFQGSDNYRYGFNGMEKDNEVKGSANSLDFGARIYDPKILRFLSLDPLTNQFPHQSPYLFAGNKPIVAIDRNGEDEFWVIFIGSGKKKTIHIIRIVKEGDDVFYRGRPLPNTTPKKTLQRMAQSENNRSQARNTGYFEREKNPNAQIRVAAETSKTLRPGAFLSQTPFTSVNMYYESGYNKDVFDVGSLSETQQKQSDYLIEDAAMGRIKGIGITGFASNKGTEEDNKDLSKRRASNAKDYILKKIKEINPDYDDSKISIDFKGAKNADKSESDKAKERRVEIRGVYD